jgi:ParB family chromosome partitioning protein
MSRKALGKGLSALLGEAKQPEDRAIDVDTDLIDPNDQQPRTRFNESRLQELAESIRANGVVQPLVVRARGIRYQIVAGERRWRAAQRAGLTKVPVVIRDVPDEKMLEFSLIENIQRENLNPVEEAQSYQKLIDALGLTQEELGQRVGKNRPSVTNYLRLLKLPSEIQKRVEDEELSMGHARALLSLDSPQAQRELANEIAAKGLSVRETERKIQRILNRGQGERKDQAKGKNPVDANTRSAEQRLCRKLGTRVRIVPHGNGGRIEIEYYSNSDLDRIFESIMNKGEETNEIP